MKQKGAVLLTTLVVLSMMSLIGVLNFQTIITTEKSLFAHIQHERAKEVANAAIADLFSQIISQCKMIDMSGTKIVDDSSYYEYTISNHEVENVYIANTTATVLNSYKASLEVGFVYDFRGKDFNPNNGWGNGDQDAPGNSLNNNNAENSVNGKEAPKGIQKKKEKHKNEKCDSNLSPLYWNIY